MTLEEEKLIKLFAENKMADIKRDITPLTMAYLQKDWKITTETWFPKAYDLFSRLKLKIEEIAEDPQVIGSREEARAYLVSCWSMSNFNTASPAIFQYEMEVFIKLVECAYDRRWTTEQMKYFKEVAEIFSQYNSYFISYTNHLARHINGNYDYVYKSVFDVDDFSNEDLLRKNLLASALHKYFNLRNLRKGFFDGDSMRISDIITEKIRNNAGRSIALVQLLSKASFQYAPTNWCYDEYNNYIEGRNKFRNGDAYRSGFAPLPFFILIEKDPFPDDTLIPDTYKAWVKEVKTRLHCDLTLATAFDTFIGHVDKLISSLIQYREDMVENVPA